MSVGEALREAREASGLSVQKLSELTKVRTHVITSMEADDFTPCGGDFYARGHIRAVAKALGRDPEPLLREYVAQIKPAPPELTRQSKQVQVSAIAEGTRPIANRPAIRSRSLKTPALRKVGPNWSTAMAAALVILIVVGILQIVGRNPSSAQAAGNKPTPTVSSSPTPTQAPTTRPAAPVAAPVAPVAVTVSTGTSQCWISVMSSDGKVIYQDVLGPGQSKDFTDSSQLTLIFGNGGTVHLVVNGVQLGPLGGDGQVVNAKFGPGKPNPTDLTTG